MGFRFPAVILADEYLGKLNAIMAMNEVAALEFLRMAQDDAKSNDVSTFLAKRAVQHGLFVTKAYVTEYSQRRYQYYVVEVHEALEVFLQRFQVDYVECYGSWDPKSTDESMLDGVLKNIPRGGELKSSPLVHLVEYYRLVRNVVAHGSDDKKKVKRYERRLAKIRKRLVAEYDKSTGYAFDAPNVLEKLNYYDVTLFTSVVLRLARRISNRSRPSDQKLLDSAFQGSGGDEFLRKWHLIEEYKDETKKTRQKQALAKRMVEKWGLTLVESQGIIAKNVLPIAQR